MSPETSWPPQVGKPLPRGADAYAAPEKLAWLLSDDGHGREWARVMHIGANDTLRFWTAIAQAVLDTPILAIRDISPYGANYEVPLELSLDERTVTAATIWHYDKADGAPRLVTAYPIT